MSKQDPHAMDIKPTHPTCGAKLRNGKKCPSWPMQGRTRCRMHGGATPVGIASPNWKTGRYSKYLPQGLGELAYEASHDPELHNLRDLIAVYTARIQHLLGLVGTGASPERFKAIREAVHTLHEARTKAQVQLQMGTLLRLVDDLEHDWMVWKDIDVAAGNMKKLMESERKRQIEMHALIPTARATDFAREIVLAVRDEVTDSAARARIHAKVEQIIGGYPQVMDTAGTPDC
jgi:hypothetical protein